MRVRGRVCVPVSRVSASAVTGSAASTSRVCVSEMLGLPSAPACACVCARVCRWMDAPVALATSTDPPGVTSATASAPAARRGAVVSAAGADACTRASAPTASTPASRHMRHAFRLPAQSAATSVCAATAACVRACANACVRACVRARMCAIAFVSARVGGRMRVRSGLCVRACACVRPSCARGELQGPARAHAHTRARASSTHAQSAPPRPAQALPIRWQ